VVDFKGRKYGADLTSRRARIVRKSGGSGHPVVDLIGDTRLDQLENYIRDSEAALYFSVPEKDALLKKVTIPKENGIAGDRLALFEFTSSLINDPDRYYFETHPLNGDSRHLVVGYNREFINGRMAMLEKSSLKPAGFKLRGWALASGYKNYCWKEGGELVCLLDISDDCTSFCLMHKDSPLTTGYVEGTLYDSENGKCISGGFLTDLSATIKYHLSLLHKSGETCPISLIIISGSSASNGVALVIEEKTGIRTVQPAVKKALFSHETVPLAPKYLVSLGLTGD